MAEEATVTKAKTEYASVLMDDGRTVLFPGKRKMIKETVIDEGKIELDDVSGIIQMQKGAVSIQINMRNGNTRTYSPPLSLYARFLGHGTEQKYGDETATTADKPLNEEDMVVALDDLDAEIQAGRWGKGRTAGGGGVSGASIVLQAILEAANENRQGKGQPLVDMAFVKDYVTKRLAAEAAKPEAERISRQAFYASFRVAGTKTGEIIKRLEAGKIAKAAKVDADAETAGI